MLKQLLVITLLTQCLFSPSLSATVGDTDFLPFEDFKNANSHESQKAPKPHWYRIEIGYAYHNEEPPGKEFMVKELPKKLSSKAHMLQFQLLHGQKSQFADYTLISSTPEGTLLEKPFPIGEAAYAEIGKGNGDTALLSVYFYKNDDVSWNKDRPSLQAPYTLNELSWSGIWNIPFDTWYVEIIDETAKETIENSESVIKRKYCYAFVRIKKL